MFKNNKSLLVIAVIAVVNALGYGIIIPIQYIYTQKFGFSDFQTGLIFATFSLCQFISTPIIGSLSDRYGRKPLLLISILGTVISFALMAVAKVGWVFWLARAIDGITAGNIPVAAAVISDTTLPKDRAKGFGLIGASFGFGFIAGPAISALSVGIAPSLPFWIACGISMIALALTFFVLPETNKNIGKSELKKNKGLLHLLKFLRHPELGETLLISLFYSFIFGLFIFAFQPFAYKVVHLSAQQSAFLFVLFGFMGLLAQVALIPIVLKKWGEFRSLTIALSVGASMYVCLFLLRSFPLFIVVSLIQSLANSFVNPLLQTRLSKGVDHSMQGEVQGINTSFQSLGMIAGPIVGGILAQRYIPLPFLLAAAIGTGCAYLSTKLKVKGEV